MAEPDPGATIAPLAALRLTAGMRQPHTSLRHRRPLRGSAGNREQGPSQQREVRRVACSFVLASVPGAAEVFKGTAPGWGNFLTDTVGGKIRLKKASTALPCCDRLTSGALCACLSCQLPCFESCACTLRAATWSPCLLVLQRETTSV